MVTYGQKMCTLAMFGKVVNFEANMIKVDNVVY